MRYQLIIEEENCTSCYILDNWENRIVALCNTKRPDLGFEKLQILIDKANETCDD